jgi:hypothetical protein
VPFVRLPQTVCVHVLVWYVCRWVLVQVGGSGVCECVFVLSAWVCVKAGGLRLLHVLPYIGRPLHVGQLG